MLGGGCRGEIIASGCNISYYGYRRLHLNECFQNTNVMILMALLAFKPSFYCLTHGAGGHMHPWW